MITKFRIRTAECWHHDQNCAAFVVVVNPTIAASKSVDSTPSQSIKRRLLLLLLSSSSRAQRLTSGTMM